MSMTAEKVMNVVNAINNFISTTKWNRSYDVQNKKLFHSRGKRVMKVIAEILHLNKDSFEIRSCLGGIAVSGEIILHSENLYIMFCEDKILYRACKGLKDYSGGSNNWMSYESLRNLYKACDSFKNSIR